MTTAWFKRRPGEPLASSTEDPSMFLVGDSIPDWVKLPRELGGAREKVQRSFTGPCPCGEGHQVLHLVLETVCVAECPTKGFMWYRPRKEGQDGP